MAGNTIKSINLTFSTIGSKPIKAPLEVWIAALISSLDDRSRQVVLQRVENMMVQRSIQPPARILTDLSMPKVQ